MDGIKETAIIDLPKEEYIHVEKDGKIITYCTMRQKVLHTIGFNSSFPRRRISFFIAISYLLFDK